MPSTVISTLNQSIRANLTAAEINVASPRGFAGYTVPRLSGQRIMIHSLIWNAIFTTFADRASVVLLLTLQRGLILTPGTVFPEAVDDSQCIFQYHQDQSSEFAGAWFPARPLPLEPGDSYGLSIQIAPIYAPVVGSASIILTVFGNAEPVPVSDDMVL
jgi:hypothetical protein